MWRRAYVEQPYSNTDVNDWVTSPSPVWIRRSRIPRFSFWVVVIVPYCDRTVGSDSVQRKSVGSNANARAIRDSFPTTVAILAFFICQHRVFAKRGIQMMVSKYAWDEGERLSRCQSTQAHHPFFRANRLLSKLRTLVTLNWTYSRSRSS
jgi:hypothetical protein